MSQANKLWEPLFTIKRSEITEATVSGILSIWNGKEEIVSMGNTQVPTWGHSLLEPWQLLCYLPLFKKAYPRLTTMHLVMMLSSHTGETVHINTLKEILVIGDINESMIRCPKCFPLSIERQFQLKTLRDKPKSLYHPCSGKHIGMLLAMRAHKLPVSRYLDKDSPPYHTLKSLLGWMLQKNPSVILETTDSCGMPTMALTGEDMAKLFSLLVIPSNLDSPDNPPDDISLAVQSLSEIKPLMTRRPILLGGSGRIDTRLISGDFVTDNSITILAKESMEGLLGVGISPLKGYPNGLGIFIKLASGYEPRHLEMIISEILEQLGIKGASNEEESENANLEISFHFELPKTRR